MKKAKNRGMVAGRWFALLNKPDDLPCLFSSRKDAIENRDTDEYLVEVHVRPLSLHQLYQGERELAARRAAAAKIIGVPRSRLAVARRPRLPLEQKRKRGTTTINVIAGNLLRKALEDMAPAMRRRFAETMNGSLDKIRPKLPVEQKKRRGSRG